MKKIFTLAELVKKYGSKAQKISLKRNKGNLTGKEFSILIKEVLTEWESYKVEGRGSKRIIECIGKRSKRIERVDKRSNNGQGQLIGEFELNSLVINCLIQNDNKVSPKSATKWISDLGIIDAKLIGALYHATGEHLENLQELFSKVISNYDKADSDIDILDEFLQTYHRHLKSSLESVFNKLSKAGVIDHKKEYWGCTTKSRHRRLKRHEIGIIDDIRHKLYRFYGIQGKDLFKTNMKEVKAFKKDFAKQLEEQLGIRFYYHAHYCVLKEIHLGVQDCIESLQGKNEFNFTHKLTEQDVFIMIEVFKDMHSKHSLELANARQKNITNMSDSDRVKSLKIMKRYGSMWELLLKYFKCMNTLKLNQSAVVDNTPIEIDVDTIEQPEERTNKEQINQSENQASKKVEVEENEQKGIAVIENLMDDIAKRDNTEGHYEYQAAKEDIRDEIRGYVEKYGDNAVEHIVLDNIVSELTREVTVEEMLDEMTNQQQCSKERECKEWEKLLEREQPVERELTTNNPLGEFKRIRNNRI